jgi:hypothetical protein
MTPKTPQGEVFCPFLLNSKDSGVFEDSKSPTLGSVSFILTLGQSGVATHGMCLFIVMLDTWPIPLEINSYLTLKPIPLLSLIVLTNTHAKNTQCVRMWYKDV